VEQATHDAFAETNTNGVSGMASGDMREKESSAPRDCTDSLPNSNADAYGSNTRTPLGHVE